MRDVNPPNATPITPPPRPPSVNIATVWPVLHSTNNPALSQPARRMGLDDAVELGNDVRLPADQRHRLRALIDMGYFTWDVEADMADRAHRMTHSGTWMAIFGVGIARSLELDSLRNCCS